MANLHIITDQSLLDLDLIHAFLRNAYWAKGRERVVNDRAIANSLCFGAYQQDQQVAFARVITDRAVFAYLADVFVVAEKRGQGIGYELIKEVMANPDLQGLRRFMLATSDASALYQQFDFEKISAEQAALFMHRSA